MVMKKGAKVITVRTSEQLKFQIELEANKQGRSVNNFLNFIIKDYIEKENKVKSQKKKRT